MHWSTANLASVQQLVLPSVGGVTGLISIYAVNIWILILLSLRGKGKLPDPPAIDSWPKVQLIFLSLARKRVAEDLDLSIEFQLKGWRYVYLPSVACSGEIPHDFRSLMYQQIR